MDAFAAFVTRRPLLILALVACITAAAAFAIFDPVARSLRLQIDSSMDSMLPEGDEARAFYDHTRLLFGSDETILVVTISDDVFDEANLSRIERLTRRLGRAPGVHHVVSLANALSVRVTPDGDMEVVPFLDPPPASAADRERLRREVQGNPVYAGSLVSRDGRATLALVHLNDVPERELIDGGLIGAIERIVAEEAGDATVEVMGGLYSKAALADMMRDDVTRTLPLAVLVAMGVSGLFFRSWRGVVLPSATTAIAVVWTLGVVTASGIPLNLMTMILPTLILVVGFAYAVHVLSEYGDVVCERAADPESHREARPAIQESLRSVALPVVLTGVTTAAGFLSLATSDVPAIVQFGLQSTLGVALTVLVALTFAPAVLALLPERAAARPADGPFERAAGRLARFDVRRRVPILLAGVGVALLSVWGATRIEVNSVFIDPGSPLERSARLIDDHLQGANAFTVVVESQSDGAFKEPEQLRALRELQDWIAAQPEVGGATSLVGYLMLIHRSFQGGDPEYLSIPDSRSLISQLFFFGADEELERFVDSRYRTSAIHVRSGLNDSASMSDLIRRIEARARELPEGLVATVTGNTVLMTRAIDDTVRGQVASLAVAFTIILAVLALLFTSLRAGVLALIPNALPVLFYFGVVGWSGVTLNSTTGLVACLVLGIAVDDSIHFLARFNSAARRLADESRGVAEALRAVGRPVTYTSIALCLGFLVLTRSEFQNQVEFGVLAAVTLAFAWLVDVTFTPALASRMHIVSLWDALTLDLGEDPHLSIPLLRGLRKTQARITALMTSVRTFPAGHRLFSAGDEGGDMYVIVDGELSVDLTTESGTVHFNTLRRGDVVGEVAFARGVRTADVTARTDVRLLRLTRESLERLRRRYPRIGAQLYANLSEILADRVATTTSQVR